MAAKLDIAEMMKEFVENDGKSPTRPPESAKREDRKSAAAAQQDWIESGVERAKILEAEARWYRDVEDVGGLRGRLRQLSRWRHRNRGAAKYFKPGDILTPKATSYYRQAGEPHVVLEVFPAIRVLTPHMSLGDHQTGARIDMRVAVFVRNGKYGAVLPYVVESWQFEKWAAK